MEMINILFYSILGATYVTRFRCLCPTIGQIQPIVGSGLSAYCRRSLGLIPYYYITLVMFPGLLVTLVTFGFGCGTVLLTVLRGRCSGLRA